MDVIRSNSSYTNEYRKIGSNSTMLNSPTTRRSDLNNPETKITFISNTNYRIEIFIFFQVCMYARIYIYIYIYIYLCVCVCVSRFMGVTLCVCVTVCVTVCVSVNVCLHDSLIIIKWLLLALT